MNIDPEDLFESLAEMIPAGMDVLFAKESESLVFRYKEPGSQKIEKSYTSREMIELFSYWMYLNKGDLESYSFNDFREFVYSLIKKFILDILPT